MRYESKAKNMYGSINIYLKYSILLIIWEYIPIMVANEKFVSANHKLIPNLESNYSKFCARRIKHITYIN